MNKEMDGIVIKGVIIGVVAGVATWIVMIEAVRLIASVWN